MAKDQVTSVDDIAHDDQKLKEKATELSGQDVVLEARETIGKDLEKVDRSVCAILIKKHGAAGAVRVFSNPVTNVVTGPTEEAGFVIVAIKSALEARMSSMNASVKRRENSIFALNPAEGSILISIDGKGTPNSGQIICRFGQPAWYRWILICSRARIPGSFFAAENHLQSSNSLPIAWTNAFGHLGVLNLRVIFPASSSSLSDEPLSALKDLIPALSELTDSDLSFGRDEIGGINNFNLTHVFETFLVFKNLQYLALAGLAATQYQLRHFLHNHRSIVRLTIEDLMIFAEDWGGVLDDIRETLFNMKANDLVQPLLRFTGESVENLI